MSFDPTNWIAATPSPGPAASDLDSDHDGMPDAWELANGFDPFIPLDADLDTDRDGLANLVEYLIGSDPRDHRSGIAIGSLTRSGTAGSVLLTFTAFANQNYTVERASSVLGPWTTYQDLAAQPVTRTVQLTVPAAGPVGFFRIRTLAGVSQGSPLRITTIQRAGPQQVLLRFTTPASASCALEYSATLTPGSWSVLQNYPVTGTSQEIRLTTQAPAGRGFFRLRSP